MLRMSDTVPAVRAQAARALVRLQQPRNKKCPIIKGWTNELDLISFYDHFATFLFYIFRILAPDAI